MLIKRKVLDAIVAGEVTLVFRRWRKPTVKAGGTLRTQVGVLGVEAVERVAWRTVGVEDVRAAGYASKAALKRELDRRTEGDIYRIALRHEGADPRRALREQGELTEDATAELVARLDAMDARSQRGPWTRAFLRLLAPQPEVHAVELATQIGWDKPPFKRNVRKLKELGLTESLSPGYRLSPRGRALYDALDD
ncbi:MAG: hypothetical protein RIF41_32745 [Polyangiaceae bacterium]